MILNLNLNLTAWLKNNTRKKSAELDFQSADFHISLSISSHGSVHRYNVCTAKYEREEFLLAEERRWEETKTNQPSGPDHVTAVVDVQDLPPVCLDDVSTWKKSTEKHLNSTKTTWRHTSDNWRTSNNSSQIDMLTKVSEKLPLNRKETNTPVWAYLE